MAKHELLSVNAHKDLRIVDRYPAESFGQVHAVPAFPTEYADIMREYPIFFRKDPETEAFQSLAMLGFSKGENLFLDGDAWQASYVPGIIARGPFLIGFQEKDVDGSRQQEAVIHIDVDDPRVNDSEGEPLFLEDGTHTPFLERMTNILAGIQRGAAIEKTMFATFEKYDLIVPTELKIDLAAGGKFVLQGFYTISQKKFAALDGEALVELNRIGLLQAAVLVMHSLGNIGKMIEMKKRRIAESAPNANVVQE